MSEKDVKQAKDLHEKLNKAIDEAREANLALKQLSRRHREERDALAAEVRARKEKVYTAREKRDAAIYRALNDGISIRGLADRIGLAASAVMNARVNQRSEGK